MLNHDLLFSVSCCFLLDRFIKEATCNVMVDHLQSRVTPWRQYASHVNVRSTLSKMDVHEIINSYMFRSVWDQIHYGMDTICLHRTGSNLNSIVSYGITFISGPIWYQRADHTGSTWSHVNIRLTNTNFILVPKGSSPCKCCLNR